MVTNGFNREKCDVLPNFYNKEIKDLDYNIADRNYVAFAGRISPEKGVPLLLEAAKKLPHIPVQDSNGNTVVGTKIPEVIYQYLYGNF